MALPIEDDTLNTQITIVEPSLAIIDGGTSEGQNLFHSFDSFSIDIGEEVYFLSPAEINNIFSRVTGGSRSEINGVLGTFGSNADLFLMNPYGVVFGADASLDVQGSFTVTTASSIESDSGSLFSAINSNSSQLFSVDPSAFFFTQLENQGEITNQAQAVRNSRVNPDITLFGLEVPNNETLLLLGGNINIDGGALVTRGGQIEIGSVVEDAVVELSPEKTLQISDQWQRGNVILSNAAAIFAASDTGSGIRIFADNIDVLDDSLIGASNNFISEDTGSQIGRILLDATDDILFADGARVINVIDSGSGTTGDVAIQAGSSIVFSGVSQQGNSSGVFLRTGFDAEGGTGNILISANELRVEDGASLSVRNFGRGNAGNILIDTLNEVVLVGENEPLGFSSSLNVRTDFEAQGDSGDIEISTGEFLVVDGAQLNISSSGTGNTGDINIDATGNVDVTGTTDTGNPSAITVTVGPGAQGRSGDITINAGQDLRVTEGAQLTVSTFGDGDSGNIFLRAANNAIFDNSSFVSVFVGDGATGNGGDLNLLADNLSVTNGARLDITAFGNGDAGDIRIDIANDVVFDGFEPVNGSPSSAIIDIRPVSEGRSGNLELTANNLSVTNGAQLGINSSGFEDSGDVLIQIAEDIIVSDFNSSVILFSANGGGSLRVEAEKLQVRDGAAFITSTDGFSNASGGNIEISLDTLELLTGGQLATQNTGDGSPGRLSVDAIDRIIIVGPGSGLFVAFSPSGSTGKVEVRTGRLELDFEGAIVSSAPGGNGGDLRLDAERILVLRNGSQISATAGNNSFNGDRGGGGNIFINAPFIVAIPKENSDITANGGTAGGRVFIRGQRFGIEPRNQLTPLSDITAFSDDGSGGEIVLGSSLTLESTTSGDLPDVLIDPDSLIASSCIIQDQGSEGTFFTTGNNPAEGPNSAPSNIYSTGDVHLVGNTASLNESVEQMNPLLEPEGVYQLADGRLVMGRTCKAESG